MTSEEREFALEQLARGRKALLDAVEGLTEAQRDFQPEQGWSIAGVVEHVAAAEPMLFLWLKQGTAGEHSGRNAGVDARVIAAMVNRGRKFPAPDGAAPTGRFASFEEALQQFLEVRAETEAYLKACTDDLRSMWTHHAVTGKIDCYTCVLMQAGHPMRHAQQIEEIKKDPAFPA